MAERAIRKMRIEIADAIESDQSGNDPMTPDLKATTDSSGVVVCSVAGITMWIGGVGAEPSPPISSEIHQFDEHGSDVPSALD